MKNSSAKIVAAAVLLASTGAAQAESSFQSGPASPITATANLDFKITIPRVLYLRVGTGNAFGAANNTTVDLISFAPSAARVGQGCGTASDCAGSGGDLTGGQVTAALVSNVGTVKFSAATVGGSGAMTDGGTNTIPFSQINVASAAGGVGTTLLSAPVWDAAAVSITPSAGSSINAAAKWTFTYANATIPPAGTYGGVNTNKGRVLYTATNP